MLAAVLSVWAAGTTGISILAPEGMHTQANIAMSLVAGTVMASITMRWAWWHTAIWTATITGTLALWVHTTGGEGITAGILAAALGTAIAIHTLITIAYEPVRGTKNTYATLGVNAGALFSFVAIAGGL